MKTRDTDLNLMEIMDRFATDEKARAYLESVRWPSGPVCPKCGNCDPKRIYGIKVNLSAKVRPGLRECAECHSQFTVTVGTIFEDSHVPLRKWLIAWYMLCSSKKGVAALQIQRTLDIGSYRTAWFMMHRIRYALSDPAFSDKLGGTVEADETWVGGKVRGHGRAYKGNKTPVVALVERHGRVRSRVVEHVTAENLGSVLQAQVKPSATLMTDDYAGYTEPGKKFAKHETVNHSAGEYVRGNAYTNTVEGFFSLFKRGLVGVYHHIDKGYVNQYLSEFDYRYNTRNVTDGERTRKGLKKAEGKRLMLKAPREAA